MNKHAWLILAFLVISGCGREPQPAADPRT